jgi:hypothetical protein
VHREGCGQILVSIRGEKPRLFCSAVVVALVALSERQMKRKREKVMACGWWLMWVDRALGNLRVVPHGCMLPAWLLGAAAAVSGVLSGAMDLLLAEKRVASAGLI